MFLLTELIPSPPSGELLYVIEKTEEQWWQALSQTGQIGSIPVPYVIPCTVSHIRSTLRYNTLYCKLF